MEVLGTKTETGCLMKWDGRNGKLQKIKINTPADLNGDNNTYRVTLFSTRNLVCMNDVSLAYFQRGEM